MKEKLERVRNYLSSDLNYIETVSVNNVVSINKKETLYDLLECWMKFTKKETIGDLNKYNRNTTRIKVKIGSKEYKINSDTTKEGVEEFLENKENNWSLINNENGVKNKITNDLSENSIRGFYMYLV